MLDTSTPIVCLITSGEATEENLERSIVEIESTASVAAACGVDLMQIREKKISGGALSRIVDAAASAAAGSALKVLVNDRADVAAACGAAGVHLTASSLSPRIVRATFGKEFLIGYSAHSEEEVLRACEDGAHFAFFSPVFDTPSKQSYGPPQGVEALRRVVEKSSGFPVLALGGIDLGNVGAVIEAGAAGVAAIRLFSNRESLADVVAKIKSHRRK